MRAIEASPVFEEAVDEQIEVYTRFDIRPHKLYLCLIVDELDCLTSVRLALNKYREVHLILGQGFSDAPEDDDLLRLFNWFHEVTSEGTKLFSTIEVIGHLRLCGCRCQNLLRYCESLVLTWNQAEDSLWSIARHLNAPQRNKTLIYNGHGNLDFLHKCYLTMDGGVTLRAREDKIRVGNGVRPKIVKHQKASIWWFGKRDVQRLIPSARFGLRRSPRSPTLTAAEQLELLNLPIIMINAITKKLRHIPRP